MIGQHEVGGDNRPFIIAEVAQTHEGSLGNAFAFAEVARDCGADAIKFQTHFAAEESTPDEPWRIPFSRQDKRRYDYWRRMEFDPGHWAELKAHCDALGITFLSSPFSIKACDVLEKIGISAWKVASGEIHNPLLIERMARSGLPMLVSTGLAAPAESVGLLRRLMSEGVQVGLFHCTTRYPTPPKDVGLNMLAEYMQLLPDVPIGLSDHTGTPTSSIVASYLGAAMIEVHLTLHPKMFGPDVSSSLTPEQLCQLVTGSEAAWKMRLNPVDKAATAAAVSRERSIFGRSLYTARGLSAGETIDESMLAYKKPGGGMTWEERGELIGRKVSVDLSPDHQLERGDVS